MEQAKVNAILAKLNQAPVLDAKTKSNQGGFSLPSVIVGSIIAAILGGVALTSMWGSVDKASIAAEVATIAEAKTAAAGVREDASGFPVLLDDTVDGYVLSRVGQMPKEFKYQMLIAESTVDGTNRYIALKATANGTQGRDRLNAIAADLDLRYDGVTGPATGKFIYSLTCSDLANPAKSAEDCYYVIPIMAKGTMPADIASSNVLTAAGTFTGVFNTDWSEADNANAASPLN